MYADVEWECLLEMSVQRFASNPDVDFVAITMSLGYKTLPSLHVIVNQYLDNLFIYYNCDDALRKLMSECLSWFTATSKLPAPLVQLTRLLVGVPRSGPSFIV